jgi:hypothetical protein
VIRSLGTGAEDAEVAANELGVIFVERARVGFLFRYAQLGEQFENALRLDLELSRQLINADFAHS